MTDVHAPLLGARVRACLLLLAVALALPGTTSAEEIIIGEEYGAAGTNAPQNTRLWWVSGGKTRSAALLALSQRCRREGGGECKILGAFSNSCQTYVRSKAGSLYSGNSVGPRSAVLSAFRACGKDTDVGQCYLVSLPLCVGNGYAASDRQGGGTADERARLTVEMQQALGQAAR
ncbi:hypothetical protein AMB3_0207 [plant metagenome]